MELFSTLGADFFAYCHNPDFKKQSFVLPSKKCRVIFDRVVARTIADLWLVKSEVEITVNWFDYVRF